VLIKEFTYLLITIAMTLNDTSVTYTSNILIHNPFIHKSLFCLHQANICPTLTTLINRHPFTFDQYI